MEFVMQEERCGVYVLVAVYNGEFGGSVPVCVAPDRDQAGNIAQRLLHAPRLTWSLVVDVVGHETVNAGFLDGAKLASVDVFNAFDVPRLFGLVTRTLEAQLSDRAVGVSPEKPATWC